MEEKEVKVEEQSVKAEEVTSETLPTEETLDEKDILKTFKSIKFDKFKEIFDIFLSFFKQKNNSAKVVLAIAALSVGLLTYLSVGLFNQIKLLNSQTPDLVKLVNYDVDWLKTNPTTKEILSFSTNVSDLIDQDNDIKDNIQRYNKYMQDLQIPYQYLLKNIYLPSLNIWKDQYSDKVDTTLIWINFLNNNPYNDVVLLQKWSNFFRNVGSADEYNDISDVNIWEIIETPDWYFYIPITVGFTANSKRAFLMLVDKLSNTSNKENIEIINEFFYYLREEIVKQKQSTIDGLESKYSQEVWPWLDQNVYMWYSLYNWIFNNGENDLVDAGVIDWTIKSLMICDNIDDDQCYYNFREKYRDVSVLAYAISKDINIDVVGGFKNFFASMPSIISIKDFTFDKIKSQELDGNIKYQGKVTIDVYGRWISQWEIDQIALVLWNQCLGKDYPLSIEESLALVQEAILKQSDIIGADKSKVDVLWELKWILDNVGGEFDWLSNYKKIIRLFEMFRMIDDAWLCQ